MGLILDENLVQGCRKVQGDNTQESWWEGGGSIEKSGGEPRVKGHSRVS